MYDWKEKWNVIKALESGGQGEAYIVTDIQGGETRYFMKVLKKETDSTERRKRLFREVACYQTLSHPQIPKLIDSNQDHFFDKAHTPYLVTEYIEGEALAKYVSENGPLPAQECFDIVTLLLESVNYIFQQDTVHRDIKPDNIILRDNIPTKPVLVDFGLAYFEDEDTVTGNGQRLGNNFFRLADFAPGSTEKRSHKSDVTLCSGILFYTLTGTMPRELRDENGHPPHQRQKGREALLKHQDVDLLELMNIFDRCFNSNLHARWETALSLLQALKRVKMGKSVNTISFRSEDALDIIRKRMEDHESIRLKEIDDDIMTVDAIMRRALYQLEQALSNVSATSGGNHTNVSQQIRTGMVGLTPKFNQQSGYMPNYAIEIIGDEVLLKFDEDTLYRGARSRLEYNFTEIYGKIRDQLLKGFAGHLSN